LQQRGLSVLSVGRPAGRDWPPSEADQHETDLCDPATLLPPDAPAEPFTLVHLAWNTARGPLLGAQTEHIHCLARLLDYWRPRGLVRVLLTGSGEEYGQRGGWLGEEDSPEGTLSPYGWGKAVAAQLSRAWAQTSGIPVVWLRPFLVYGPGQRGNMVIPYALRQALAGLPAEFSDGQQCRDFVYVDDVVEAFFQALSIVQTGWQAINLGTGNPVQVREVLETLANHFGVLHRFRFGVLERRPGEPDIQVADPRRAMEVLGWRARIGWREGIGRLVQAGKEARSWAV
jgi:nucleoside-diphosphate-sugar epimerase